MSTETQCMDMAFHPHQPPSHLVQLPRAYTMYDYFASNVLGLHIHLHTITQGSGMWHVLNGIDCAPPRAPKHPHPHRRWFQQQTLQLQTNPYKKQLPLSRDLVIFPANWYERNHWTLLYMEPEKRRIVSYDPCGVCVLLW